MKTKTISSTETQNNFGRVMDSVVQEHTAYVVRRRGVAQVMIIGLEELRSLLRDASDQERMGSVLREISPDYELGEDLVGVKG